MLYGETKEIKKRSKSCPLYERPDIPNEFETEIPLLNYLRYFCSLDEPGLDGESSMYERIDSHHKTPLEILIEKEEYDSDEAALARKIEQHRSLDYDGTLTFKPFSELLSK